MRLEVITDDLTSKLGKWINSTDNSQIIQNKCEFLDRLNGGIDYKNLVLAVEDAWLNVLWMIWLKNHSCYAHTSKLHFKTIPMASY